MPAPLGPTSAIRLPGLEPEVDVVERRWLARGVAGADAFEGDRERRRRQRRGLLGIRDGRLAVCQLEQSAARRERLGQLARGLRERLHGFE